MLLVSKDDVNEFFDLRQVELNNCPYPSMIIKLNELVFINLQELYKNSTRNSIFFKSCLVYPVFKDDIDSNNISVFVVIILNFAVLKPLFISTTINPPEEAVNTV